MLPDYVVSRKNFPATVRAKNYRRKESDLVNTQYKEVRKSCTVADNSIGGLGLKR